MIAIDLGKLGSALRAEDYADLFTYHLADSVIAMNSRKFFRIGDSCFDVGGSQEEYLAVVYSDSPKLIMAARVCGSDAASWQ
jgi:hypothetical protein